MMRKRISGIIAAVLTCTALTSCSAFGSSSIKVQLDGRSIDFADAEPTIINGSTLVPMRAIFEALGAEVSWDGDTQTASGVRGGDRVSVTINDRYLIKNGVSVELNEPAAIIEDRTMVPVRAISEAFGCAVTWDGDTRTVTISTAGSLPQYGVPAYSGEPYAEVNGNMPYFTAAEITGDSYEYYSELDGLGRVGVCHASIGRDLMPTEERGSIGMVKPSGWQIAKYDFVDGKYLYNRCHLIGYQLSGENANERNLMTGTRYMNVQGMLPFENEVADYVKDTGNHVMYRATPVFEENNLVADGIILEAESVEDGGAGVRFNVFCYNVQPGVVIDYTDGSSYVADKADAGDTQNYILNTNSKKFHKEDCKGAAAISEKNRQEYSGSRQTLIEQGYLPCGLCDP